METQSGPLAHRHIPQAMASASGGTLKVCALGPLTLIF